MARAHLTGPDRPGYDDQSAAVAGFSRKLGMRTHALLAMLGSTRFHPCSLARPPGSGRPTSHCERARLRLREREGKVQRQAGKHKVLLVTKTYILDPTARRMASGAKEGRISGAIVWRPGLPLRKLHRKRLTTRSDMPIIQFSAADTATRRKTQSSDQRLVRTDEWCWRLVP